MTHRVVVSEVARDEFLEIYEYLKNRFGKNVADGFRDSFKSLVEFLKSYPFAFPIVPERPGIRKCSSRAPTVIFYEVVDDLVTIHRVRDGRRSKLW